MKPMGPIPTGFVADTERRLLIGGRAAVELAAEAGGTPLLVYDSGLVEQQIRRFRAAMPADTALHYAVKANPYAPLLSWIAGEVDGFDVASAGELGRVAHLGLPISFAGPGKTDQQLETAMRAGVTINLESEGEAERALAIAAGMSRPPKLAVRVNPPFALRGAGMKMGGMASQFGIDHDRAPALIKRLIEAGADWRGLHIFTGSQALHADALIEAQTATLKLAAELAEQAGASPPEVNLGGGFGIPYFPGERRLDLAPISANLHALSERAREEIPGASLVIELGRYLVGEAGIYVARVIDRKVSRGQVFLVTDGGLHHHLSASGNFGQVVRKNYPTMVGTRAGPGPRERASVVGPLCTPLDLLADRMELAVAEPGDLVVVFQSGAYGASASPQGFLGHPPCVEVLV